MTKLKGQPQDSTNSCIARVCALVFLSAITSILSALLWTILKKDISGGFTAGGTIFIVLTSGVGSLEAFFGSRTG